MQERTKIIDALSQEISSKESIIKGWVRTKRGSKNVIFIALNDGSTINNLQVVVEPSIIDETIEKKITTGASISVRGILQPSQGSGQNVELQATEIKLLGKADPDEYPLQPKKHSLEFLREKAHLRMRTSTFSAVMRIRNIAAFAVHEFFNKKGFVYLHTPIITGSDAEGAGEMFQVTSLDLKDTPLTEDGKVDFSQDFFGKATNLTVSGQLEGELGAMALGEIYTFGPTFRAENSNTTRHLSEFWMIEPEMAFYELKDDMALAEEFIKYLCQSVLYKCKDDLAFLNKRQLDEEKTKPQNERNELNLIERLTFVIENDFKHITYTEAINILLQSKPHKKGKFEYEIKWGIDLQSEHERFLVEKHFKKPLIITDYPKDIKAFYMKLNEDGKTVAAMDVLFPGIGEIIGGSQREDDLDKLKERMTAVGIAEEELYWYLDTRKFGSAPHSGFGLGFERFVLFATGMSNIRDVIPFPRAPKSADF